MAKRRFAVANAAGLAHKGGDSMAFRSSTGSSGQAFGLGGKIVGTLFLGVFLGAGLLFAGLLGHEIVKAAATRFWTATPCTIVESGVSEEENRHNHHPYVAMVEYRYEWEGKTLHSPQVSRSRPAFGNYGKAAALVAQYPANGQATCYVNPKHPEEAVLRHDSLLMIPFMIIPLIFIALGAGGILFIWKARVGGMTEGATPKTTAALTGRRRGAGCLVGFFAIFFLAGSGFLYGMFLRPLYGVWQSRSWEEVPCVVESSRVQSHRSDDGTTYSVDILYAYEFRGVPYKSSRYGFSDFSSSGRAAKQRIVRQYRPGRKTTCYVNPADPTQAVLYRGVTGEIWFVFLPLVFIAVGLGGMIFAVRKARRDRAAAESGAFAVTSSSTSGRASPGGAAAATASTPSAGPVVLKPASTPLAGFLGSLAIALFWNGIVSVFLVKVIGDWRRGHPSWFETLFLVPFVLVGLGLIVLVVMMFLKLFNPRARLMVSSGAPRLGERLKLSWVFTGAVGRLREVDIALEAREEATYRRGTTSHTDTERFYRREIAKLTNRADLRAGQAEVVLPADSVPSFDTGNNKIIWSLKVRGDIPHWPDVDDEFPLTVRPLAVEEIRSHGSDDKVAPLRLDRREGEDA